MVEAIGFTTGEDPRDQIWDLVVIGAGLGGATLGFELSRRGRRVLFLEKGLALHADPVVVRGESLFVTARATGQSPADPELRMRHGFYPIPAIVGTDEWLAMGCGTGGGSALFSMVMDRMFPVDFSPALIHAGVPEAALPEVWPITYDELKPFYREAEQLYRVRGSTDRLRDPSEEFSLLDPPVMTEKERDLTRALEHAGFSPFRIHYACEQVEGCTFCTSILCKRNCRNDADRICLEPAVHKYGARILTRCSVLRLVKIGRSISSAVCDWNGRETVIHGKTFVLAAGALISPLLLLRSACADYPEGLANSSGLVGRNLMFHISNFALAKLKKSTGCGIMNHGISFNDLYFWDGQKLGNIHIHGFSVTYAITLDYLQKQLGMRHTALATILCPALSIAASIGARLYRDSVIATTILEDLPYPTNRVVVGGPNRDQPAIQYVIHPELRQRSTRMREVFSARTKNTFSTKWTSVDTLNPGHMCGTIRFGDNPKESVLDANNRAHGLENLYVVDSSFFPTSGGINPSLTIAANALRVARIIDTRL